jgi:L-seryl-tRNA(Ser) seleniumtransferase
VIISRGELVQIGGGFRIGEILETSGARLREVGATNKTVLRDYAKAVGPETGMILKVHQSNFFMSGFAGSPPNEELARLAHSKRIPFVEDLGSGAVVATETLGLNEHEPTPNETLKRGADLVCFSGDKLLGGPQAGIIAGKARFIAALKKEPLFRALRCDKLILAALSATVDAHLRDEEVPVHSLLKIPNDELRARGEKLIESLHRLPLKMRLVECKAEIGGGTLPRSAIASIALEVAAANIPPDELASRLRKSDPPVIGYIARGKFLLDLRTIFPFQDEAIVAALTKST